jgi:hypothetical protein
MALLLTKSDLLGAATPETAAVAAGPLQMTRHALRVHFPDNATMAISSLGPAWPASLQPDNLAAPLSWLLRVLQAQDEARMDWLWPAARGDLAVRERCVECFTDRYPQAPSAARYAEQLATARRARRRRRGLMATGTAACLLLGLASYDVLGRENARRFEAENAQAPAAILARWQSYQAWHPTRSLFQPGATRAEEGHLRDLAAQARRQASEASLAELRRRGNDPDADPEAVWREFQTFRADYPEVDIGGDLEQVRTAIKVRRDVQMARRAQQSLDRLVSAEQNGEELTELLARTDGFLRDHAGTPQEADVRKRRDAYLQRIDEHDIETARSYSAREPLNFQTRREHYQRYLDRHPDGAFRKEAEYALKTIDSDWDRHDFRAVRDHLLAKPGDMTGLVARCRSYLAVHAQGQFAEAATDLLRWSERVTAPGEYKVVLRSGSFDRGIARWLSRGPDLSVELEVAGVRYGPSPIVANSYNPEWYYEFSRPVRWKLGDPVRIRVVDHDWKDRVVLDIAAEDGDPLGMRLLTGEIASGAHRLTFESEFALPTLPRIE